MVFDKSPTKTYMQVLYRGTHWLRFWAQLQRCDEDKEALQKACQTMEVLVMQIFAMDGGLAIGFALNKCLHQTFGLAVNLISVIAYGYFEKFVIINCSLF